MEQEVEYIKQQTALLGEDGEAAVGRVLDRAKELASNRVMLRELSVELEKGRAAERMTLLEVMEVETIKLQAARGKGDMAGITQLVEYLRGIEADEGEGGTSDPSGKWRKAAMSPTRDILQKVSGYRRDVGNEKEDALGLLRKAIGKLAGLNETVSKAKNALEEEGLYDLGRKLGAARKELMSLGRVLIMSQDPSLAAEAHDLVGEAEDAVRVGQQEVKAALRRLGVASDLSETGSLDLPLPSRSAAAGGQVGGRGAQAAVPRPGRPMMGPLTGPGGKVADLIRCLARVRANDSGWPMFDGKYLENPPFRKEWWAYRQTWAWHVRDELVCRALKERSLANSVRILVSEGLQEAWDTLDTCFDRPKKYIIEAIDPIVKLRATGPTTIEP